MEVLFGIQECPLGQVNNDNPTSLRDVLIEGMICFVEMKSPIPTTSTNVKCEQCHILEERYV